MDLVKARRSNPRYARLLGWGSRYQQVAELLGFRATSPSAEQFAFAVADWQRAHAPLTPDGMIGSRTWRAMEPLTRFNAGPGPLPVWLIVRPQVQMTKPPTVIPRPPMEAVQMAGGRRRHRAYDRAFSDREMEAHMYRMEMLSAAQTLGRSHATLMRLAADPPPESDALFPPVAPGGSGGAAVDRVWEERQQFDEVVDAGHLVAEGAGFRSTIPRSNQYRELEAWYGMDFVDEFNVAVRDHWQFLEEAEIVEGLSLIAELLVSWGVGAVARRAVLTAAVRAAGGAALQRVAAICRQVLTKCREFVSRLAARIRGIVNRITGGGRPQIVLCPRSGRTIAGIGDHPPIDIGDTATNPSATFDRVVSRGHHQPPAVGQGTPGANGVQAVDLTMADSIDIAFVADFPASQTWGSSPAMLESYAAKWAGHGLPGNPPPYGFRVFRNGSLVEVVVHVPENPLVLSGRVARAATP